MEPIVMTFAVALLVGFLGGGSIMAYDSLRERFAERATRAEAGGHADTAQHESVD